MKGSWKEQRFIKVRSRRGITYDIVVIGMEMTVMDVGAVESKTKPVSCIRYGKGR
jgi:hypothetical protein